VLAAGQKNIAYICSRYYRAPELLFGATFYTQQVDIWSLGCVIAEMMTNRSLFEGSNSNSMLIKIIRTLGSPSAADITAMMLDPAEIDIVDAEGQGVGHRIRKLNPLVDEELVQLVELMIVYSPEKRITADAALQLPLFA
jgi:glycogen synthase kinase 3 beta